MWMMFSFARLVPLLVADLQSCHHFSASGEYAAEECELWLAGGSGRELKQAIMRVKAVQRTARP